MLHGSLQAARCPATARRRRPARVFTAQLSVNMSSVLSAKRVDREKVLLLYELEVASVRELKGKVEQLEQRLQEKQERLQEKQERFQEKQLQHRTKEELLELRLQTTTYELMAAEGLNTMRGLIVFAERKLAPAAAVAAAAAAATPMTRRQTWQAIFEAHPQLQECIYSKVPDWRDNKEVVLEHKSRDIYKSLAGSLHPDLTTGGSVRITEGHITREEMSFLECIAISCNVPYTMHYKVNMQQSASSSTSDDDE